MRGERSVVDVLNDILGNLQRIVHSEIRLGRAEVVEELGRVKSTAIGVGVALLAGGFTVLFVALAAMHALTVVLTAWGAALVVAGAMGFITILAVVFTTGALRARHVAMPSSGERTKENRG